MKVKVFTYSCSESGFLLNNSEQICVCLMQIMFEYSLKPEIACEKVMNETVVQIFHLLNNSERTVLTTFKRIWERRRSEFR